MTIKLKSFKFTPELVYLIEALKVEGHWAPNNPNITIQNKNLPFLTYVERLVSELGIVPHRRILIKIKPNDQSFRKEEVTLFHMLESINFHIETSPFDGSRKIVTSLPYSEEHILNLDINNKRHIIEITKGDEELQVRSSIHSWAYQELRFSNADFLRFVSDYVGNKKTFRVEDFLFSAKKEHVAAAFSALIDAEGSINHYGHKRAIRVRMRNKKYLSDWVSLLTKFGIYSKFSKNSDVEYQLCINGWEDFDKLKKLGVNFYQSKRAKVFDEIMNSYKRNQISRGSAEEFYSGVLSLSENLLTAEQISVLTKKNKRTVNHYLNILKKKNKVRSKWIGHTCLYSLV